MELEVTRFSSGKEATLGYIHSLFGIKKNFVCFTLEDEQRAQKVLGETRIPRGRYKIVFRRSGKFHTRYKERWPSWHTEGSLEIENVPGFTNILIHTGNTDDDTAGCLLVGDGAQQNVTEEGSITGSRSAYERLYKMVKFAAVAQKEEVWITFIDYA